MTDDLSSFLYTYVLVREPLAVDVSRHTLDSHGAHEGPVARVTAPRVHT